MMKSALFAAACVLMSACAKPTPAEPVKPIANQVEPGDEPREKTTEPDPKADFDHAVRLCLGAFATGAEFDVAIEASRNVVFAEGETTQISQGVKVEPNVDRSSLGWDVSVRTSIYQPSCEIDPDEACWDREAFMVCTFKPGPLPASQADYVVGRYDFQTPGGDPRTEGARQNDAASTLLD